MDNVTKGKYRCPTQDWRTLAKWKKAVVVTWTTPAPPGMSSARDIADYLDAVGETKTAEQVHPKHREVWQKDTERFVVVSWFCDMKASEVALQIEDRAAFLAGKGFDIEVLKYSFGKNYTEEAVCFQDCVRILESVDGYLVDINEIYSPLSVIQYYNGYQLKGECENPNRHLE